MAGFSTSPGLILAIDEPNLEAEMAVENRNQLMTAASPDFIEGMPPFLEKPALHTSLIGMAAAMLHPRYSHVFSPLKLGNQTVTNHINMPDVAEAVLARSDADLVSMVRPMPVDAELAKKARTGREDEIETCTGCN